MSNSETAASISALDVKHILAELEVPFPPDQVRWRVTNTSNDKKRGQIVPYADPRAYTDRLNALFTPQGWTREYKVETMGNITRMKKGEPLRDGSDSVRHFTFDIELVQVLFRERLRLDGEFLACDDGNPKIRLHMFWAFLSHLFLFLPGVLQELLVIPERQDEIPDADADVSHYLQQLCFFLKELANVGGHLVFLVIQEDAEIVPVLAGVTLVRCAVMGESLNSAISLDVSRDVLVGADRLAIAHLQHFLDVLFPIIWVPRIHVARHTFLFCAAERAPQIAVFTEITNAKLPQSYR